MTPDSTDQAVRFVQEANSLLVLTGAGISVESGVPPYRGPDGVYQDPNRMMYYHELNTDPEKIWSLFDRHRQALLDCSPNRAHSVLAAWEQEQCFDRFLIATQNIDGFHQEAGNQRVSELHGNLWTVAEPRQIASADDPEFSEEFTLAQHPDYREEILEKWSSENGHRVWEDRTVPFERIPPYDSPDIRPHLLLFNEPYNQRLLWVEEFLSQGVDVVLVIGCSGAVQVLDRLLRLAKSSHPTCRVINVNPDKDSLPNADVSLVCGACEGMEALAFTDDEFVTEDLPF